MHPRQGANSTQHMQISDKPKQFWMYITPSSDVCAITGMVTWSKSCLPVVLGWIANSSSASMVVTRTLIFEGKKKRVEIWRERKGRTRNKWKIHQRNKLAVRERGCGRQCFSCPICAAILDLTSQNLPLSAFLLLSITDDTAVYWFLPTVRQNNSPNLLVAKNSSLPLTSACRQAETGLKRTVL